MYIQLLLSCFKGEQWSLMVNHYLLDSVHGVLQCKLSNFLALESVSNFTCVPCT